MKPMSSESGTTTLPDDGVPMSVYLSYNVLIAPAALALLWPLPGPNLIGYWFAYRAVHHWLILRGIRSVRKGRIVTHYHADTTLDQPVKRDPEGKACHAAVNGKWRPAGRLSQLHESVAPGQE